jgi:hypothetical protein
MSENEFRFIVVRGFLVEFFDRRHFTTGFGQLDSIADKDGSVIDLWQVGVRQNRQHKATPKSGEGIQHHGLAMKEIKKPVIENHFQAYGPDKTGNASQIGANG